MEKTISRLQRQIKVLGAPGCQKIITRKGTIISVSTKKGTACSAGMFPTFPATDMEVWNMDTKQITTWQSMSNVAAIVDQLGGIETIENFEPQEWDSNIAKAE